MFFDIHSHILPHIDDGAKNLDESVKLLEMLKEQGVTAVIATPHFYPEEDSLESFLENKAEKFKDLKQHIAGKDLPEIYLGCEMPYFKGIGNAYNLEKLCLNNSNFLLLELDLDSIHKKLFEDLQYLISERGITPIMAHLERYFKEKNYRKLLKFLKENKIPAQVNAASFTSAPHRKALKKLIKSDIAFVVASDAHSSEKRPPKLDSAFAYITEAFGEEYKERFYKNSQLLYERICCKND